MRNLSIAIKKGRPLIIARAVLFLLLNAFLVTKNLFGAYAFDGRNLLQCLDVEVLLVAEDDVSVWLVCHVFLFKLHDILQRDVRQCLVDGAVDIVIDAEFFSLCILSKDGGLCGALGSDTFHQRLLSQCEGTLRLWYSVDDGVEGAYAVHHLIVL